MYNCKEYINDKNNITTYKIIIIDYEVKNNIIWLYKKPYEIITTTKNSLYNKYIRTYLS